MVWVDLVSKYFRIWTYEFSSEEKDISGIEYIALKTWKIYTNFEEQLGYKYWKLKNKIFIDLSKIASTEQVMLMKGKLGISSSC